MPPPKLFGVKIKVSKKFEPHVRGQRAVLKRIGAKGANMIRDRVERHGRHADGRLPPVSGAEKGWFIVSAADARYRNDPHLEPRRVKGDTGDRASLRVSRGGYRRYKRRRSGKTRQAQSLSGEMWDHLTINVTSKGVGRKRVTVGFTGTERVKKVDDPTKKRGVRSISIRNRDKAYFAQFSGRGARGRKMFDLMAYTRRELERLRDMYVRKLRLFRRR